MLQLLVIAALVGIAPQSVADQTQIHVSPAGDLRAVVSRVGPANSESRIEIRSTGQQLLRYFDLRSPDGEHGFSVYRAAWTEDGRYFVFSVESSGGHQPWHLPTYAYSRQDRRFYSFDEHVGLVTSAFELLGDGRIAFTRLAAGDPPHHERVIFQLSRLGRRFNASRPN